MIKQLIMISSLAILLGGCTTGSGNFDPKSTVRIIHATSYPEFPDIKPVARPTLQPWSHDFPRNTEKVTIKNLSKCLKVAEDKRDDAFWARCGENPIMPNSNIHVGFDQSNWNIIINNFAKLRETLFQYEQRIIAINKQRQEWRRKAEEERKRLSNPQDASKKSIEDLQEEKSIFENFSN